MRRMLIDQDQAVCTFHQDIKLAENADDLELLLGGFPGIPLSSKRFVCRTGIRAWRAVRLPYNLWAWRLHGVDASGCASAKMWQLTMRVLRSRYLGAQC